MNSMRVLLDLHPFKIEIKLSGPTPNRQLRQALLQVVEAIDREQVNFKTFMVLPERTYNFSAFGDPVWRAKHTHTILNRDQPGYELRLKRLKLGLSGREFARLLEVHPCYLSHVEHGRKPVSEQLRVKAESVFRTELSKAEGAKGRSSQTPLATVAHEGQTFFEDLQVSVNDLNELKLFFEQVED